MHCTKSLYLLLVSLFYLVVVLGTPVKVKVDITSVTRFVGHGHGQSYRAAIHMEGEESIHLNLKKSVEPVFHPNIKVFVSGENGHEDVTPSKDVLDRIENSIFEDGENNAVVSVSDQMGLNGMVNGRKIIHTAGQHHVSDIVNPFSDDSHVDYVNSPYDPLDWVIRNTTNSRNSIMASGTVELFLVIDFSIQNWFGGNVQRIMEYYALFIKGVNNIYATSPDPNIKFVVIGFSVIRTRQDQAFLENNRGPDGSFAPRPVLEAFATYMLANTAQFPQYDSGALLTAENFGSTLGIAYISGACKPDLKHSMSQDPFASFAGVKVFAHEMGHNLGSWHDGEETSAACPINDGFIMHSQGGFGDNQFRFSQCSKNAINNYISSVNAGCLYLLNSPQTTWPTPPNTPGDLFNLDAVCRNTLLNLNVRADQDPNITPGQMCTNVRCELPPPCAINCKATLSFAAPDGAKCSSTGTCNLGKCVPTAPFMCTIEGTFQHADCTKYYKCIRIGGNIATYTMTCPTSSYFDSARKLCLAGVCP